MKKAIIITCLIGSGLLVLDAFQAADSLTLLLLAGVVPGTDLRIPAVDMMAATATAITIIILRLTVWPTIRDIAMRHINMPAQASPAKKRTVKRVV